MDPWVSDITSHLVDANIPCSVCRHGGRIFRNELTYIEVNPEEPLKASPRYTAKYSIVPWVASPSIPVLYFNVYETIGNGGQVLTSLDKLIGNIVPEEHQEEMRGVVSQTEHPVTGLPTFFIHPCHTDDLRAQVGGDFSWKLWLQFFGQRVGLMI